MVFDSPACAPNLNWEGLSMEMNVNKQTFINGDEPKKTGDFFLFYLDHQFSVVFCFFCFLWVNF